MGALLRRLLGAGLHLLAAIGRGKNALERARGSEELRRGERIQSERRCASSLRKPQQVEQIGAHRRDCVRALGPQERLLRILQIRLDVQRQLLGRTALGHLVREEVDARDRIADGDAVGRVSSAHQVAQASHPAQRLRRSLRQGAPGSFERSSLARSQPDRDRTLLKMELRRSLREGVYYAEHPPIHVQ